MKRIPIFLLLGVLLAAAAPVQAHQVGQSYIFLDINEQQIHGRFEITLRDLNAVFANAFDLQQPVERAALTPKIDDIRRYVAEHSAFQVDGVPTTLQFAEYELLDVEFGQFAVMHFVLAHDGDRPGRLAVEYRALFDALPDHRALLVVENDWRRGVMNQESNVLLAFTPQNTRRELDLSGASVLTGLAAMIELGTHHIWIGIDHILFLIALLLPCVLVRENARYSPVTRFRPALLNLVTIVTVFTIAHTITLSYATLSSISLSPRIVESIIALSIAVAALDCLMPLFGRRVWLIVFGFGLFHGFGFASVLGEIGIPDRFMAYSLFGFNVGVELGQLAIVAIVFPILYVIRAWPPYIRVILPAGALALIAIALYWFVERAFEIDLPAGALLKSLIGTGD